MTRRSTESPEGSTMFPFVLPDTSTRSAPGYRAK